MKIKIKEFEELGYKFYCVINCHGNVSPGLKAVELAIEEKKLPKRECVFINEHEVLDGFLPLKEVIEKNKKVKEYYKKIEKEGQELETKY